MKLLILFGVLVAAAVAEYTSYEGYTVYRVVPTSEEHVQILKIFKRNEVEFDFWTKTLAFNKPVDIMVEPQAQQMFLDTLTRHNISYDIKITNVESAVKAERLQQQLAPRVPSGRISFSKYHRYADIQAYLNELAKNYPSIVTVGSMGNSHEGRPIQYIKISTGGPKKPAIFVDAAIHAREWIAPPVALYIIQELVENSDNWGLIENVDWHIVPVLNPDGYEYSHTNARLWRKTRSPNSACYGTDGNRNFDFHWMEVGASAYECSDTFAGQVPFSEPETRALRDYIIANADDIKLYLTFHSYGEYLLYPWGFTSALPQDEPELKSLAIQVCDSIATYRGTEYTFGTSTNVLYAAAGGSDDWVKGVAGIDLSYTLEFPGGWWGFELPASEIKPVVEETWLGIVEFHNYIQQKFGSK